MTTRNAAVALTAGFLAVLLPWLAFSLTHGGAFASQLHHNIAYDVFARSRGIAWDTYQRTMQPEFRSLGDVIARNPGAVIGREFANVFEHLWLDGRLLLGWPVAVCAAVGLLVAMLDRSLRRLWPLVLICGLAFVALVPAFHSARYSLAVLPLYATLAAVAVASPRFAFPFGPRGAVWGKALLAAIPLLASALAARTTLARSIQQLPIEVLDSARALRAAAAPGDRVIARKAHIGYHAGLEVGPFPFVDSLAALADYAHRERVRFLFASWPEAQLRPAFAWLLDTSAAVPGLRVVAASSSRPAVVYEIGPGFGAVPAWMRNDTLFAYHLARGRLHLDASNPEALKRLGGIEAAMRRDAEAARHLDAGLARAPRDLEALLALGETWLRLGDAPRSGRVFERAVALAPREPRAHLGLGWAQLLGGDSDAAARTWRPVLTAGANSATLARMFELYTSRGDTAAVALVRSQLAR
ncbi:MAG: hypothetical protein HOP12_10305 [Candidatus Eisenbacteria bacterium]|uniref:Tetratricopeptide repeat protein n=1 Tax=Eiseniibacteriota bacterium TaxID=2212470 RepID=A0A849SZN7_UNCEI|nr:hypothetical protein [Candidatus Eisenbacteria bacterium]